MAFYITVKQSPRWEQMTLEEFIFGDNDGPRMISANETNTRTYKANYLSERFLKRVDVEYLISILKLFNQNTEFLRGVDRKELYRTFYIPKKSGGLRQIDAPNDQLKGSLYQLKGIFEDYFNALYHTSAFAYVKGRSTLDAMKKHQRNESKWFGKYDLSNFFGSITMDFAMNQLSMIFPFCEVIKDAEGKAELEKALELGFLNGGLPQGTPLSPTLTNILMIPIDFEICNKLRRYNDQSFIYTRYADDFQVSSRHTFDFREIENVIKSTMGEFNAPMKVNESKTRYGSSSGRNWNLGLMLNKDNNITVGHKKKKQYEAMLAAFIMDTLHNNRWDVKDVMVLNGYRNYYKQIEGEVIDRITEHIGNKFSVNPVEMINSYLTQ